jgi:hypothetical protein
VNTAVRAEIVALRDADGLIHAGSLVDWARQNSESALHTQFEWDDQIAGERYRVEQARRLIAIHVVDVDLNRQTVSLVADRRDGGYRDLDEVLSHHEMRRLALLDALSEVKRWQERHGHFASELKSIFRAIEEVDQRLRRTPRRVSRGLAATGDDAAAALG